MRSSYSPPYFEIIKRGFRFGLSADRLSGNIVIENLLVNWGFARVDRERQSKGAGHSSAGNLGFLARAVTSRFQNRAGGRPCKVQKESSQLRIQASKLIIAVRSRRFFV